MPFKRLPSNASIRQHRLAEPGVCLVCGDQASVVNYGALSCWSCRTFFRRHGFRIKNTLVCYYAKNCSITIETRKLCTTCRLRKCLAVGMSPDFIRKEDLHDKLRLSKRRKQKLLAQGSITLPQPWSLNLLSKDQSSLTSTNWQLLSNVVHAFDSYQCIPIAKDIVKVASDTYPPSTDRALDLMTIIYTSLQSFIECIADFRVMTSEEQRSLFHRNMQGLLAFYCVLLFREAGIFRNHMSENTLVPLYGYNNVQRTKYISNLLDYDLTLVKLALTALTFSSNCYMTSVEQMGSYRDCLLYGTFRLFGSQNVYAELLWRYMLYKYDFSQAVRRFDALIKASVDSLTLSSNIYESNRTHQDFADELALRTEFSLQLNETKDTPLWGKKTEFNII
ncbi:unnamed protein product [Adineta ricciae]|uniref:Nuclear receptor domain-containing protein n=1 Tax=Adineta ricciae TaxID=249248 RepID=A0A815RGR8_ADIRI|nr:unnamed protein product [Adineta ricciae]CAF1476597.1 unnamed protein product [Adineta ricciae]